MKEFIEKLKSKLKEKLLEYINKANDEMIENGHTLDFENHLGHKEAYENVLYEIVNELAEEYKDQLDDEWQIIYDKVCVLEKKYTNERNIESVKDCIRLENLLQYFKEELQVAEEYNNGWIPCSERLPKEHDSIFAKFKGTSKWHDGMFEKISDDVNVTVGYEDGTRKTDTLHTVDGAWAVNGIITYKVIAWQPLPQPYKAGGK